MHPKALIGFKTGLEINFVTHFYASGKNYAESNYSTNTKGGIL